MSIRSDTLKVTRELRAAVSAAADAETRALARAWARAWDEIVDEFTAAAEETAALAAAGEPPTIGQVRRMARARRAVDAAEDSIHRVLTQQTRRIGTVVGEVVDTTVRMGARQIGTQLPRSEGTHAELQVRFDRVSREAMDAIVERTTDRIVALSRPLTAAANEAMLRSLIRAVPEGASPRTAARRMVGAVEGRFNGGLARALTISRTEILDAYRRGASAQQRANRDILDGWVWTAQLDSRTCPSCVAEHGTLHDLDEFGPDDHQNGRCARTPHVRPWSELGFSIPEPPDLIGTGREWFDGQPESTQLAIMGDKRLEALRSGRLAWDDVSVRRRTAGWRDSMVPIPVGDLDDAA